jgi:hypothetical protein
MKSDRFQPELKGMGVRVVIRLADESRSPSDICILKLTLSNGHLYNRECGFTRPSAQRAKDEVGTNIGTEVVRSIFRIL